MNKIVVRYADGKIIKGSTQDLFPNKTSFHVIECGTSQSKEIKIEGLKAIFFVRSFEGRPQYEEKLDVERVGLGKKIEVTFNDGEKLVGYTQGFTPARAVFIVFPCDPECNNEKVLIITAATRKVQFI